MTTGGSLIALAEAQARLLALVGATPPTERSLADANGHVLASPLMARRSQPAADLSAMDGYAIRWADMPGPWQVTGESAAGRPFAGQLSAGEAARISTGAIIPEGADCVLVQEDCARDGDMLRLTGEGPSAPGAHIRRAGHDFAQGALLAAAGTRVDARLIALAAMAGHGAMLVHRAVSVAILSTGDELVPPGEPLPSPAHIPSSNGAMLAAMLTGLPVDTRLPPLLADRLDVIGAALSEHRDADIIVTTGGASVGDHDLVQPALLSQGGTVDFWRIAMRPGKPVMVARLGNAIVLGLPGNPVSAYVTALLMMLPLVRRMAGLADILPVESAAPAGAPFPANGAARQDFMRARLIDGALFPIGNQDSGALAALCTADALVVRPIGAPPAAPGDMLPCIMLQRAGLT